MDRLNSHLLTQELFDMAKEIMRGYQEDIDKLMTDTCEADVAEAVNKNSAETIMANVEEFASRSTAERMAKYGQQFFVEEMERVLDAYNDAVYDEVEFNIRCEILTGLRDSMINFKQEKLKD